MFDLATQIQLRCLLEFAWQDVTKIYLTSRINSERSLQACLFERLSSQLSSDQVLLCEPSINVSGIAMFPDLIILNDGKVQAVLELKFVPHHYPTLEDLGKLMKYGSFTSSFPLLLNSKTGKYTEERFVFAPDCLLVFAVVGQHDSKAVDQSAVMQEMSAFDTRFMHLSLAIGTNSQD